MLKLKLHWQILIALILAVVIGAWAGQEGRLFGVQLYSVFDFVGSLFLNALKMIIVPLIVASIIVGIAGIGGGHGLARLGGKTILYYMVTSLAAILIGLFFVNLLSPGLIDGQPAGEILGLSQQQAELAKESVGERSASDIAGVFLSMIPANIVAAAANGQMLGLIFFSLLYGFFMTRIEEDYAEAQYNFWNGVFSIMMGITDLVMKFAPLGVFALVAKVVAETDLDQLGELAQTLGLFVAAVLLALLTHVLVLLPLLLKFVGKVRPQRHYRAMAPALLTAFSTASSAATLPLTMECVEKNAGVSNRTSSVVLPLGATINMDGTALYECVAALFIAQAYGLELGFVTQFTVVLVALLTSIGVAGIPAASLVAIVIILATIGLPLEALGLILAVDRILDMFRTSVNVFSDSCGAVIIARTEGETDLLIDEQPAVKTA
ncbi:dicarboxylate/amino acid:cation symporter [Thiohalophilus sp.]|uniref:dicarboxylate/amino acid:cation symporter n=1 Tax=Thiohalophilus sp. TaxID=3028392 RepID=UPI002ACD6EC1|nr:dicarboxylate/amino acid:cation symporter [Thiohalophilus sp.]MDZ7663228.1 dicarboxylate/amino acid:cation symporter [Thiohalophilus sp.]